jgi:serine/threonine protein phosphatase PrpC
MTDKPRGALRIAAAGLTDVGRQRRHNEDHILLRPELGLYVVADGMGGHNAGNVASALVTTSVDNFWAATEIDGTPAAKTEDTGLTANARRIAHAIRKANRDVYEISSTHQQHHGMGSTVVAAYLPPNTDELHVAHVGDSRCYRVRDGQIKQLTRDHSLINDALDIKPDLTDADLARLPKNIITRALGMKDVVKVDVRTEKVRAGDIYLLCSDGLSGMVTDADLGDVLGMTEHVQDSCEVLVAMANDAGGTDNISAVVVRVLPEVEAPRLSIRMPSVYPRPVTPAPSDAEIAVDESELDEDVFAGPGSAEIQLIVGQPVTPETEGLADGTDLLIAEDQDIGALAEMLDDEEHDEEQQPLTIPFDMPAARCRKCRADLLIGTRFCVECGAPSQPASSP